MQQRRRRRRRREDEDDDVPLSVREFSVTKKMKKVAIDELQWKANQ
jgi:hypothetical protein